MEAADTGAWDRMTVLSLAPDLNAIRPLTMVPDDALLDLARQVQFILVEAVPGDLVECGVWRGGAALLMADMLRRAGCRDRKVWLFDSFAGLPSPETVDGPAALAWAGDGRLPGDVANCVASLGEVRDSAERLGLTPFVELVPGWFSETLPQARKRLGSIALLRIDADWHASVQCCLEHLYDLVVEGGFVAVDDYYAYDGCAIALHEFLGRRRLAHRIESVPGTSAGLAYAGAVFRKAPTTWGQSWPWLQERHRTAQEIAAAVPADAAIVLVDGNQYGPAVAGGRAVVPFLERHGEYWGPPPDDATAIHEIQRLRAAGATFLVVARPAFWWLDHYSGLHRYLRSAFAAVLETDHLVVFDLRDGAGRGDCAEPEPLAAATVHAWRDPNVIEVYAGQRVSDSATPPEKMQVRRLWAGWKRVGKKIADVQSRALLTLVYFTVIAPFGLAVRWAADPLALKPGTARNWRPRPSEPEVSLDSARRQF